MKKIERLRERRKRLKSRICGNLDILIGTVNKTPVQSGYYLTYKADGISKTRYVRKDVLGRARLMVARYRQLKRLLKELSNVNWELLKAGVE